VTLADFKNIIAISAACLSMVAAGGCRSAPLIAGDVKAERVLRSARLGTTVAELETEIGPLKFVDKESGNLVLGAITRFQGPEYFVEIGTMEPIGSIASQGETAAKLARYNGFFNIKGRHIHSIRWVYTDGLIQDEQTELTPDRHVKAAAEHEK
jgi:hypothetical protein